MRTGAPEYGLLRRRATGKGGFDATVREPPTPPTETHMPQRAFVHGTTYYHEANPPEELAANFAKMRDMGLNTVRVAEVWPGWEFLEPEPGVYDFDALDDYVEKAVAAGLDVVMGVGVNNPPFWVFEEIEDVRTVDVTGRLAVRRIQSANHDNPRYREVMARFVDAQARRYGSREGVVAWQFGNEVRYGVNIADNACTRERFRAWLRESFEGDLDALNRKWATRYRDWDEVYPYLSRAGAPTQGLSPLAIATRAYQAWSLEEWVAWGAEIIRRHSDRPVFHNSFNVSGLNGSHWRQAAPCDLVVHDVYPTLSGAPQVYSTFLLDCAASVARAQGKPLWIGETSVGQYGTYERSRPPQALIESLVMEMLAAGAKGLLYFRHKAPRFEQPHKFTGSQSVLRRDGSAMEYVRTPEHVTRLMEAVGDRLLAAEPVRPEAAVYYPEESLRFAADAGYADLQRNACFGASSLWNRLGLPVDVLPTDELLSRDLSAFRLIYLPVSYLLPRVVGECLADYVRHGGTLVAECRPGYVDENGWLYEVQPGAGLHEVFGAREDLFWNESARRVRFASDGTEVAFPALFQTWRPEGAEVVARNDAGEPAAVRSRFGEGDAVLFGFAPSLLFPVGGGKYEGAGAAATSEPDQRAALAVVGRLAEEAGLTKPVQWDSDSIRLSARYLESDRETLLFLANHGPAADVDLPPEATVIARGGDAEPDFTERRAAVHMPPNAWLLAATPAATANGSETVPHGRDG